MQQGLGWKLSGWWVVRCERDAGWKEMGWFNVQIDKESDDVEVETAFALGIVLRIVRILKS
jgi:hypothetical protein